MVCGAKAMRWLVAAPASQVLAATGAHACQLPGSQPLVASSRQGACLAAPFASTVTGLRGTCTCELPHTRQGAPTTWNLLPRISYLEESERVKSLRHR